MKTASIKGFGLLLTLVLMFSLHLSGGLLVCIGDDGHVAIEASNWRGDCNEGRLAESPFGVVNGSTHCGGCLDVEIAIDQATRVSRDGAFVHLPPQPDVLVPHVASLFVRRNSLTDYLITSNIPSRQTVQKTVLIL
jgi:hypothetical protein